MQELDRLSDFIHWQRRRIGFQIGDDTVGALKHRAPVLHGEPHLAEYLAKRAHDICTNNLIGDRLEMNMDEALARAAGGVSRAEYCKVRAVAPDSEYRMRHQLHGEPALGELAHNRVDQERHVVVDDLDNRDRLAFARLFQRHGLAADFRSAGLPLLKKIERPLGQVGEIGDRVAQHILRYRSGVELRDKRCRDVTAACGQRGAGLLDGGAGGVFVLAGGNFGGHGAGRWLRESVEHGSAVFMFQGGRREQPTI